MFIFKVRPPEICCRRKRKEKFLNTTSQFKDLSITSSFRPPGQFSREPEVNVYDIHEGVDPLKQEATMEVKGNRLHVTRYAHTETSPVTL